MWRLETWQLVFLAGLGAAALLLSLYVEGRRLLHSALDDRYGEMVRFWRQEGWGRRLHYAVAYFFCHGVRDLMRLATLVAFDLFVVFAFLAPFWRYLFFGDWNPALAAALALAGASIYLAWKVRQGMALCAVHGWSEENWRCQRCGEYHLQAEERTRSRKAAKGTAQLATQESGWWNRLHNGLSWHRFWERRLQKFNRSLEDREGPRPAA